MQLDYSHPFSDGNSGILRELTQQLSAEAGYQLERERFDRASAQHPELRSVYDGWRRLEWQLAQRFPDDQTSRDQYPAASCAELIRRWTGGGILPTPEFAKAAPARGGSMRPTGQERVR